MALLSLEKRKQYFEDISAGDYTTENIKKFQKKYMKRKADVDGIYGNNTDNALRTVWNVWKYTKNFNASEFVCECGGKYCSGFPSYMKDYQLKHLQTIRDHYGKPMIITCGLRCKTENKRVKGIPKSLHLTGEATDSYMKGVSDTLANRRKAIKYIKTLKRHHYTYGNACNSYDSKARPYAPGMGNALHTDTK